MVFGWIGDRVNTRQTPFLLGLIALGLSTLAIAITRQLPILLAARIFQGLSSAVVASVGYAILFDVVGSEKIGQALGYISMGQSVGLMVGPAIGGPLYEYGGYFVTFIPAFVLIAVEIMLRSLVVIPPTKRKGQPLTNEVENPNAALLSNEDAANPSYGTSPQVDQKDASPEGDSQNLTTTTLHPSNSTKLTLFFTSPRILTALAVLFALNTVLTLYDAIIPVYVRATFAFTAANASALFLIMVSAFLLSPLAGHIVDRHGTAFPATIGMLLLCAPVFGMSFINTNTANPFFAIAGLQFAIGFAAAICLPALMAEVSLVVEGLERERPGCFGERGAVALAFGVINTAFGAGFWAGPAVAGWLMGGWGWRVTNCVMGGLAGGCVVFVGGWTGGGVWRRSA